MRDGIFAAGEWIETHDAERAYSKDGIDRRVVAEAALRHISADMPEVDRLVECAAFIQAAVDGLRDGYQAWVCEQADIPANGFRFEVDYFAFDDYDVAEAPQPHRREIRIFRALIPQSHSVSYNDDELREQIEADALEACRRYWVWKLGAGDQEGDRFEVQWLFPEISYRTNIGVTERIKNRVEDFRRGNNYQSWSQAAVALIAIGLNHKGRYVPVIDRFWGGKR